MHSPDPVIRAVTPADVSAVTRLQVASWHAAYAGIIPAGHLAAMSAAEREQRHLARVLDPEPRAGYLLAERDQVIIGMADVGPARDDDLEAESVGEIRAMYADPAAWSTGVGAALMRASLGHLGSVGFTTVTLWVLEANARARAFYERWGFRTDGARQVIQLGDPVPEVRYYLQLVDDRSPGPDV